MSVSYDDLMCFYKNKCSVIARQDVEIEQLRALLGRCLKSVEGGKWRDNSNLSAEAHPVWDDVREALDR